MSEEASSKSLPTYLNADYVRQALAKALATTSVSVKKFALKHTGGNGENFCSDIYRAHVTYEYVDDASGETKVEEKSLIFKDLIKDIADIGTNELYMYEAVLPAMEKILADDAGLKVKFNADLLLYDHTDKELFVMEDLNASGFTMGNRWKGLDLAHAKLLLRKIAQFHAASMIYAERFPVETAVLGVSHFAKGDEDNVGQTISSNGMNYATKIVEQWTDYEQIAAKMRAIIGKFNKRIREVVDPRRSRVNVINHGDLWVNNFLYSYEGAEPKDVVFVDFQCCFLGSPGFDINYFFYTSVELSVLKSERYALIRHYYAALKETLQSCGATEIPTWQMIADEVRDMAFFGYYAVTCELPICAMSKEAGQDFDVATFGNAAIMEGKNKLMYNNERVHETLRYALDYLNEMGVLD